MTIFADDLWKVLNVTKSHVTESTKSVRDCKQYIWRGQTIRLRCGNVSFLNFNRFSHVSRIEIWIRTKNVVSLYSQTRSCEYEWRLRLSIARASSALHSPCTSLVNVKSWEQELMLREEPTTAAEANFSLFTLHFSLWFAGSRPPDVAGRNESNTM